MYIKNCFLKLTLLLGQNVLLVFGGRLYFKQQYGAMSCMCWEKKEDYVLRKKRRLCVKKKKKIL